jgi:hypothetical protein
MVKGMIRGAAIFKSATARESTKSECINFKLRFGDKVSLFSVNPILYFFFASTSLFFFFYRN